MLERAVEIIKSGNPEAWPKTKENKERVNELARFLHSVTGDYVECGWCNRGAVYKHLKKWLEGHGHL
jgi:hypothetical protein